MDIDQFGTYKTFKWDHNYLVKVLTTGASRIVKDPLIANALKNIKRGDFVDELYQDIAYTDQPIPIGYGQTTSQPTVIAQMLELLKPQPGKKYLEIGAGSGYVTALLSFVAGENGKVYALERNQYLVDLARHNLSKYPNLKNYEIIFKDGSEGLASKAPFDYIYSAAAFKNLPNTIKNQLVVGGRLVAPTQADDIRLIERISPTDFDERVFPGYIFVPIVKGIE